MQCITILALNVSRLCTCEIRMMRIILKCFIALTLWIAGATVRAALTNNMFNIRHIGYAEGLSSQRVFSIVEDSHGAMWIATKTGIDRYNGHIIKSYTLPVGGIK